MLTGGAIAGIVIGSIAALGALLAFSALVIGLVFRKIILNSIKSFIAKKAVSKLNKCKSVNSELSSASQKCYENCSADLREQLKECDERINLLKQEIDKYKKEAIKHKDSFINTKLVGIDLNNVKVKEGPDFFNLMKKSSKFEGYSDAHLNVAAEVVNNYICGMFNQLKIRIPDVEKLISIDGNICFALRQAINFFNSEAGLRICTLYHKKDLREDAIEDFISKVNDFIINDLRVCDVVNPSDAAKSVSQAKLGEFIKEGHDMFENAGLLSQSRDNIQINEVAKARLLNWGPDVKGGL